MSFPNYLLLGNVKTTISHWYFLSNCQSFNILKKAFCIMKNFKTQIVNIFNVFNLLAKSFAKFLKIGLLF